MATTEYMLDVENAAEYLGLSAYHVRKLARESRIPASLMGRSYRFRRADLDAYASAHKNAAPLLPNTLPDTQRATPDTLDESPLIAALADLQTELRALRTEVTHLRQDLARTR